MEGRTDQKLINKLDQKGNEVKEQNEIPSADPENDHTDSGEVR
jgi:hypothetical protein